MNTLRPALCSIAFYSLAALASAQSTVTRFPADKAAGVNPDTHLVLTFSSAPTLGKSGLIRIYDAADNRLVDTLDLSIPAGPAPAAAGAGRAGGGAAAGRGGRGGATAPTAEGATAPTAANAAGVLGLHPTQLAAVALPVRAAVATLLIRRCPMNIRRARN